jgi:hypothetical protein
MNSVGGRTGRARSAWIAIALIVAVCFGAYAVHHHDRAAFYSGEGFAAFYCGGEAIRTQRDPYLVEPMRSCEARANVIPRGVVEPAPLPPITLGFFAVLSFLPYGLASVVWALVLLAALVGAGRALVALAPRVPPIAIWTAMLPGIVYFNGYYGEVPGIAFAGLVFAAYGLRERRTLVAVLGATLAVIFEPHVGGAAWLAMLVFVPRVRVGLVALALVALVGSLAEIGWASAVSYATQVLPQHAASEVAANDQYSLTAILYQAGVPARAALLAGSISYLAALVLGIVGGGAIARRLDAPEFIVFLPAAAVLCGGTFIHDLQMGLAVPLAVAALNWSTPRYRALACVGLLVGAVPEPGYSSLMLGLGLAAAFAADWTASGERPERNRLLAGVGGAVAYVAVWLILQKLPGATVNATQLHYFATSFPAAPPGDVAEGSWRAYVTAISHPPTLAEQLARLLQYLLLFLIYGVAARTQPNVSAEPTSATASP